MTSMGPDWMAWSTRPCGLIGIRRHHLGTLVGDVKDAVGLEKEVTPSPTPVEGDQGLAVLDVEAQGRHFPRIDTAVYREFQLLPPRLQVLAQGVQAGVGGAIGTLPEEAQGLLLAFFQTINIELGLPMLDGEGGGRPCRYRHQHRHQRP